MCSLPEQTKENAGGTLPWDGSHYVPILHAGNSAKDDAGQPSPSASEEDLSTLPGQGDAGQVFELRGSVPAAVSEGKVSPSFRYQNIANEVRRVMLYKLTTMLINTPPLILSTCFNLSSKIRPHLSFRPRN